MAKRYFCCTCMKKSCFILFYYFSITIVNISASLIHFRLRLSDTFWWHVHEENEVQKKLYQSRHVVKTHTNAGPFTGTYALVGSCYGLGLVWVLRVDWKRTNGHRNAQTSEFFSKLVQNWTNNKVDDSTMRMIFLTTTWRDVDVFALWKGTTNRIYKLQI